MIMGQLAVSLLPGADAVLLIAKLAKGEKVGFGDFASASLGLVGPAGKIFGKIVGKTANAIRRVKLANTARRVNNFQKMGLKGVKLAGKSFNSGRKQLEKAGFKLVKTTKSGRKIFRHPKTGATVTYDSGKALGAGQSPHWTIQDKSGDFFDRSGRRVDGPSPPMRGRHIQGG